MMPQGAQRYVYGANGEVVPEDQAQQGQAQQQARNSRQTQEIPAQQQQQQAEGQVFEMEPSDRSSRWNHRTGLRDRTIVSCLSGLAV